MPAKMFHNTRLLHRWIGAIMSLFMIAMAVTGILLAVKKRFDWIQPTTNKGAAIQTMSEVVPLSVAAEAVFALGLPELRTHEDFDRFELHVSKNIFKVTSTKGYREVQVEAKTGKVLSVSKRNDMMIEQIHDMSFFSAPMHDWLLPVVALSLLTLGISGIYMFFVPIARRWQFRRKHPNLRKG